MLRSSRLTSPFLPTLQGSEFTHANEMIANSGPALLKVTDPAGGTDKLVFDIHGERRARRNGSRGPTLTTYTCRRVPRLGRQWHAGLLHDRQCPEVYQPQQLAQG